MSRRLRKIGLRRHYMCFGLLHVGNGLVSWCSAGIPPPVLIIRKSMKVEKLESKGMPLASVDDYPYQLMHAQLEAGVRVIEHGQLLDRETLQMMAENDVWLSTQVLRASTPDMNAHRIEKRIPVIEEQPRMWAMARELGVRIGWGTDFLFEPALNREQNHNILLLREWFSAAEILKLVTHDNAQMLALSGLLSPYQCRLGVVKEASKTIKNIKSVYVKDMKADVEDNKIVSYGVIAKVSFEVERD